MRAPQGKGEKGSLRWIQHAVNEAPERFGAAIAEASKGLIGPSITWHSPLRRDEYAEYRDEAFLELLDVRLPLRPLDGFWPKRGPQWDALGRTAAGEPILVEAKANVREVITPRTGAREGSFDVIQKALSETAAFLGVDSTCDWTGTFYQYTNRLAHLYLLEELNEVRSWLIFVYFVGDADVGGPGSVAEWKTALEVMYGALGLGRRHPLLRRRVDVFIDVRDPTWQLSHVK